MLFPYHRLDTKFNMPNLTSVQRLARFYEDDNNYFVVLEVDYRIQSTKAVIEKATFVPIEFLSWDCLTIGALGWGQVQIANSNFIRTIPGNSRKKWMLELCDNLFGFYPREIEKIGYRVAYFEKVKRFWEKKEEQELRHDILLYDGGGVDLYLFCFPFSSICGKMISVIHFSQNV